MILCIFIYRGNTLCKYRKSEQNAVFRNMQCMKTMTLCGHYLANVSLSSVPAHTAGAPPPHAAPVHLWHILALPLLAVVPAGCPREPYTDLSQAPSLGETLIPGSLVLTYRLHQRGTDLGWAPLGSQDGLGDYFETSLRKAAAVSGFTAEFFQVFWVSFWFQWWVSSATDFFPVLLFTGHPSSTQDLGTCAEWTLEWPPAFGGDSFWNFWQTSTLNSVKVIVQYSTNPQVLWEAQGSH